jgi:hypothetical protein
VANTYPEVSCYAEGYSCPSFTALDSFTLRPLSKVVIEAKIHKKQERKFGGTTLSLTAKERNLTFLCASSFSFLMKFRSLILLSLKFGKGGWGRPFFIILSLSVTLALLLENDIAS